MDDVRQPTPTTPTKSSEKEGWKRPRSAAVLAGWLTIVAGLLTFFNGLMAVFGGTSSIWFDFDIGLDRYTVCGMMIMAFGAVAIAGGASAVRGKSLSLALAGAALGAIGGGFVGFLLGLTAIALLFLSNEDL